MRPRSRGSATVTRKRARNEADGAFSADEDFCGSNSVVECNLAKVEVEGSNPFSRSIFVITRSDQPI